MDNTTQLLIVILGSFAIGSAYYAYRESKIEQSDLKEKKPSPLKNIKLYTESGDLIESFEGVHMVHWDTNIYLLYDEEGGNLIQRIDKGENMLLTATNVVAAQ